MFIMEAVGFSFDDFDLAFELAGSDAVEPLVERKQLCEACRGERFFAPTDGNPG